MKHLSRDGVDFVFLLEPGASETFVYRDKVGGTFRGMQFACTEIALSDNLTRRDLTELPLTALAHELASSSDLVNQLYLSGKYSPL